MNSPITTHVLDTGHGRPAQGVRATLERRASEHLTADRATLDRSWQVLGQGTTDADGRIGDLLPADHRLEPGRFRLRFAVGEYYTERDERTFYPEVTITFEVTAADEHYHVPLLLNAFGYSTYRGS